MGLYPTWNGLLIVVPLSGRPLVPQFTIAFSNQHPPINTNVGYWFPWKQPVDEARNGACKYALERKCKYIYFIDEDVTPPPHALRQLVFQADHHPEGAVFTGIYCSKSNPPAPLVFRGNGSGSYWDWKVGEFFEISGCGMGCTLIRVDALRDIDEPYFKTINNTDAFLEGIPKGESWTEDLFFLNKMEKKGWKFYADASIIADHWDEATMTAYNLPQDSFPMRRVGVQKGTKKIVDLGCGSSPYKTDEGNVVTVDIRDEVKPDYRADLRKLPFGSEEFDIVHSCHVIEHFSRADLDILLNEWIRILKKDGELRLIMPDLEWAADRIKEGKLDKDVYDVLYGSQNYDENFHRMGFTDKLLQQLLEERGFNDIRFGKQGYNLICYATRNGNVNPNTVNSGKKTKKLKAKSEKQVIKSLMGKVEETALVLAKPNGKTKLSKLKDKAKQPLIYRAELIKTGVISDLPKE